MQGFGFYRISQPYHGKTVQVDFPGQSYGFRFYRVFFLLLTILVDSKLIVCESATHLEG
jgi:hypothetical protein